jgi:hypothetical protein
MSGIVPQKILNKGFAALCLLSLVIYCAVGFVGRKVYAADIANRSISISTPLAGAQVEHTFRFDLVSTPTVGSIQFLYCTDSPVVGLPCNPPVGLDVTTAVLDTESGITGFTVSGSTTANSLVLTRPPALQTPVTAQYVVSNFTNPTTTNMPVYVRIMLYDGIDATGTMTDFGSVVYMLNGGFDIGAYVPPYLTMCIGKTVALNCSNSSGAYIDLGIMGPTVTKFDTSQFSVATNDYNGFVAYVMGNTMTAGNIIIPRLTVPSQSTVGVSQFGINLRDNGNPDVGTEPFGVGTGTPSANYNTPNQFMFETGNIIASSPLSTDFTRMTVSYIVNVDDQQNPGRYNTTLTYLGVAQF